MTKWNEELTADLRSRVGDVGEEVSRETVAEVAEALSLSPRSVSSKLRKEGFTVETVSATPKSYTDEEEAQLRELLENEPGEYTYQDLADQLGSGHTARSIGGKVLSMELTANVKATPPKEKELKFTEEETAEVVRLVTEGAFIEDIAAAVRKPIQSIRGKALSLQRAGTISQLPAQRDKKPAAQDVFEGLDIPSMSVEQLVEKTGKTPRGIKTMLTRRRLTAQDYDGAKRAEKATVNS